MKLSGKILKNLKLLFISLIFIIILFLLISLIEYHKLDKNVRECESTGVFRDICLHNKAKNYLLNDEDKAWKMCYYINDPESENECYKSIILELTKSNLSKGEGWCGKILSEKWRGECFFNLALDYVNTSFDKAVGMCEKSEIYKVFCYHDVVGSISKLSPESALNICDKQTDGLTMESCFHGIGLHSGRFDWHKTIDICNQISKESGKENCYHGLGWALSESDLQETLNICQSLNQPYNNRCLVGASWQVARTDKEKAKEVCLLSGVFKEECLNHLTEEENVKTS